ncbi:MAG: cell division protein FtsQ/DivIB [Rhodothalassiaceae bacterium]
MTARGAIIASLIAAAAIAASPLVLPQANRWLVPEPPTRATAHISGAQQTRLKAVAKALGSTGCRASAARQALLDLPWVTDAQIRCRVDGIAEIAVAEHVAVALWQKHGQLFLIAADGTVIADPSAKDYGHLPLLVGAGAPQAAGTLLTVTAQTPDLAKRIYAAVRVGQRRWDIVFRTGIRLALPDEAKANLAQAWARFARLQHEQDLLAREIIRIDLRRPDRIGLQLTSRGRALMSREARSM